MAHSPTRSESVSNNVVYRNELAQRRVIDRTTQKARAEQTTLQAAYEAGNQTAMEATNLAKSTGGGQAGWTQVIYRE